MLVTEANPESGEEAREATAPQEAKKKHTCRFCGAEFEDGLELGRHTNKEHQEELKAEKAAKKAEAPPRGEELWKGEPDATAILRQILEKHPDISRAHKDEVLSWAELRGQLDPQSVAYLLGQMKGISSQTASIIAQKYSLAIQKAQLEGRPGFQMPILPHMQGQPYPPIIYGPQPQQYPFQFPQQAPIAQPPQAPVQPQVQPQVPQQFQPYYPAPPFQPAREQLTKEDIMRMIKESREEKPPTKEDIKEIINREMTERGKEKPLTKDDIREIINKEVAERGREKPTTKADVGQMMKDEKEETINAVRSLLKEDREEREKETLVDVIKDGQEQTRKLLDKIEKGELIKIPPSAGPPPAPAPTKEEIAEMAGKAASEAAAKVVEARTKEDREERRHAELLATVRSSMAAQQVSGYREDSYRLLGQGLTAIAGAMERKEPIKIVLEHAPEILYGITQPGPKELVPGATGLEMAAKIKPEWIAEE